MRPPGRRWLPGRSVGWVVEGGLAAVALALAGVTSPVTLVARRRWEAALDHRPAPHPPGQRGPQALQGQRQRRVPAGAARAETPWETVAVDWSGGRRQPLGGFAPTALWPTRGVPPVDLRGGLVGDPEGQRRLAAFVGPDLQATPGPLLAGGGMRGSVAGTCAEGRAHLGWATQRPWSDQAMARPPPVLVGLCSLGTLRARQLSPDGPIPVPVTACYHTAEPTVSDGLGLVRQHRWRARDLGPSPPEAAFTQFPREALDLLIPGLSRAASLAKAEL